VIADVLSGAERWAVTQGDALEVLRTLPDGCADFCLCDPPYGLGSKEPKPAAILAYLSGESELHTGDFMGSDWNVPPVAVWRELFRCLKPGAHLFAFGGTRTWDLISMGIRMAGFESRDTIAEDHPALRWIQASGMAKGQNVSKAMERSRNDDVRPVCRFLRAAMDAKSLKSKDVASHFGFNARMVDHWAARDTDSQPTCPTPEQWERLKELLDLGDDMDVEVDRLNGRKGDAGDDFKERPIIGHAELPEHPGFASMNSPDGVSRTKVVPITKNATAEADEWEGYGSCLAPTWEPILVFRKPLEGTLAQNALKHGVGPLNIDACRTFTDWQESDRPESWKASGHTSKPDAEKIAAPPGTGINCHPKGRWPKNAVLIHSSLCRCVGVKKVDGDPRQGGGTRPGGFNDVGADSGDGRPCAAGYASPDGTETVPAWECVDGCPIALLERQAGNRKSGAMSGSYSQERRGIMNSAGPREWNVKSSEGSAARFFPTFPAEPFFYAAKVSPIEREIGCEHLEPIAREDMTGREPDSVGQNCGRSGVTRQGAIRNHGKCVKPQAVLRWLARLGGRPGGVALVPYAGTGSECAALVNEGMRVIGIERDPSMLPIAEARISWWQAHPGGPTPAAREEAKLEAKGQLSLLGAAR